MLIDWNFNNHQWKSIFSAVPCGSTMNKEVRCLDGIDCVDIDHACSGYSSRCPDGKDQSEEFCRSIMLFFLIYMNICLVPVFSLYWQPDPLFWFWIFPVVHVSSFFVCFFVYVFVTRRSELVLNEWGSQRYYFISFLF